MCNRDVCDFVACRRRHASDADQLGDRTTSAIIGSAMIESSGPDSRAVAGAEWYRYDLDVRTPALFVSFGSPLALQDQDYSEALRRFGIHLRTPRGVLIASPYWRTVRPLRVTRRRGRKPFTPTATFRSGSVS
jgi:hypothetical protein